MPQEFTESVVEEAALEWFEGLGYSVLGGPEIAYGEPAAERTDPEYRDMILEGRLRQALTRLNPDLPPEALDDAFRKLTRIDSTSLITRNRDLHSMLVDGVNVEYVRPDGSIAGAPATLVDFDNPENNDWLAVNQFTVTEGQHARRPDVVVFLNGLPIAVIELKKSTDENATHLERLQPASDVQRPDSVSLRLQRAVGDFRRNGSARGVALGGPRVVHAVANHRR